MIALIDCVAFSTGFEFAIAVRAKEEIDPQHMGFGPPHAGSEPEIGLQIGIQFADGPTASTGGNVGPELMAYWKMHAEGREPVPSDGPILAPRSGGGGGKRWDFSYWVWPLPPEGKVRFMCKWPARNLAPITHEIDGAEVRRAGTASTSVWRAG